MFFNFYQNVQNIVKKKFLLHQKLNFNSFKNYSIFHLHKNNINKYIIKNDKINLIKSKNYSNNNKSENKKLLLLLKSKDQKKKERVYYFSIIVLLSLALTYASVPIYRIYCQAYGKGGKPKLSDDFLTKKVKNLKKSKERLLKVQFTADTDSRMSWKFQPVQNEIKLYPGETALAFYTAKNPLDRPINGISTYSVSPFEAGQYLHKIQCFCFEEQRLEPGEEVDMPVFFYFDPEYLEDPRLENIDDIVLSYTFFEAKEGIKLPFYPSSSKTK